MNKPLFVCSLKNKLMFLFVIFLFSTAICKEKKEDSFFETLKDTITELVSKKVKTKQREKKYKISKKVKNEIDKQIFRDSKKSIKDVAYKRGQNSAVDILDNDVFIYKVPFWPFYSLIYQQGGIFQIDASFDFVTESYSSGGDIQDLSNLVFSQKDMCVSDILLVSRLLDEGIVNPSGGVDLEKLYFYILADQPLIFDASMNKQEISLNYAKHFARGDVSWGFQIPLVRRKNELKLTSDISDDIRRKLYEATQGKNSGPNFFEIHGDLEGFVKDILEQKGLIFNKKDSEFGLGDISTFINFEFDWKKCERLLAGINFLFPSSKDQDTSKLWDPELGQGFIKTEFFGSILFGKSRFFNPHVFAQLSISLPKSVKRRVPELISYDGIDPAPCTPTKDLIYGNNALYKEPFADEPDTMVRYFADTAKKIKIYPNPEFFLRIGNMFERFLFKRSFLDLFYDLLLKGKDYLRKKSDSEQYYKSVITKNSYKIAHTLGLNYSYQFDEHFRLNLGGRFTVAGRNAERLFQINLSLNSEF